MDEILAMGAQLDDRGEEPSPLPTLDGSVHEIGASYALAAPYAAPELTDVELDEDETVLDPVILAGLVHA